MNATAVQILPLPAPEGAPGGDVSARTVRSVEGIGSAAGRKTARAASQPGDPGELPFSRILAEQSTGRSASGAVTERATGAAPDEPAGTAADVEDGKGVEAIALPGLLAALPPHPPAAAAEPIGGAQGVKAELQSEDPQECARPAGVKVPGRGAEPTGKFFPVAAGETGSAGCATESVQDPTAAVSSRDEGRDAPAASAVAEGGGPGKGRADVKDGASAGGRHGMRAMPGPGHSPTASPRGEGGADTGPIAGRETAAAERGAGRPVASTDAREAAPPILSGGAKDTGSNEPAATERREVPGHEVRPGGTAGHAEGRGDRAGAGASANGPKAPAGSVEAVPDEGVPVRRDQAAPEGFESRPETAASPEERSRPQKNSVPAALDGRRADWSIAAPRAGKDASTPAGGERGEVKADAEGPAVREAAVRPSRPGAHRGGAGGFQEAQGISSSGPSSQPFGTPAGSLREAAVPKPFPDLWATAAQKSGVEGGRVRIVMSPEHLGTLDMNVTVRRESVEVLMSVQREESLGALRGHAADLRAALSDQGLRLESLSLQTSGRDGRPDGGTSGGSNPYHDGRTAGGSEGQGDRTDGRNGGASPEREHAGAAARPATASGISIFA